MSIFDARYNNDVTGRKSIDPKLLLKIVLYGYSRGMISSRSLEYACKKITTFMALACNKTPHHSTIAAFVSSINEEIEDLFTTHLLSQIGKGGEDSQFKPEAEKCVHTVLLFLVSTWPHRCLVSTFKSIQNFQKQKIHIICDRQRFYTEALFFRLQYIGCIASSYPPIVRIDPKTISNFLRRHHG